MLWHRTFLSYCLIVIVLSHCYRSVSLLSYCLIFIVVSHCYRTVSLLFSNYIYNTRVMFYNILVIRSVSKKFGEWYEKTNKTEDTNKLTSLAFKIIAIIHNTLLATFTKLLETVSKGLFRNRSQNRCHTLCIVLCSYGFEFCVRSRISVLGSRDIRGKIPGETFVTIVICILWSVGHLLPTTFYRAECWTGSKA
jgi:hypothetical protein